MAIFDHVERRPLPAEQRAHFSHGVALSCAGNAPQLRGGAGGRWPSHDRAGRVFGLRGAFLYPARRRIYRAREEFEAIRGTERYLEGLKRLQMSQQFSTSGRLGQVAYIAEKPGG